MISALKRPNYLLSEGFATAADPPWRSAIGDRFFLLLVVAFRLPKPGGIGQGAGSMNAGGREAGRAGGREAFFELSNRRLHRGLAHKMKSKSALFESFCERTPYVI